MTVPGTTTTNVAGGSSYVGMQAGTVHGDVSVYTTFADDPPEKKFETGARFLDGGMPGRAWQLINEAVMAEYRSDETCFHRLLALVSGRTRRELSPEEAGLLRDALHRFPPTGNNAWADGLRTVHRLLDSAGKPEADLHVLLKEFDKLGRVQRAMILRHLEVFLDGPLKDKMWHRALTRAAQEQMANGRADRVWKFFQPDPTGPRKRMARPPVISLATWAQAMTATTVFAAAAAHIGYLLVREGPIPALLGYLLSIVGGYLGARDGAKWRFHTVRRREKDRKYGTPPRREVAPPGGFARRMDQLFDHYSARYVPRGTDRAVWLAATAGIRRSIRDELADTYRETRTGAEKVAWLIRYRVGDVKERWEKGTLWNYRKELVAPLSVKTMTILGLAALACGGSWAVGIAILASPLSAACSAFLALVGGWIAARAWLRITLERRRSAADKFESECALEEDRAAFERWKAKLADKPEDHEMAAWLDHDRKVLLNEALQHYKLAMSDVIAHAFIETPAPSAKRARVRSGPWRYAKYQLLVFLLTADGVRQLAVKLDFGQGTFHDRQRINYRFEAVAAVRVSQSDDDERIFELALVNGQEIKVQVTGPGMEELQQGESPGTVFEVTLDAAGLQHTLHVLEGIAAEGKEWITHEHRRGQACAGNLATAVQGPTD
ncbi:hypothetical protein [Streptosporangium sp. NPDC051022]|uniref:hypothetical protein n=1 Tax=Streptosporangium sp. NPDC051022 TaxID=3155752 RepID=UPI00342DF806